MNENEANNTYTINNVCRVCLNTTKHLHPMSNEHIKLYKNLVDEIVHKEYSMKICMLCQWMLQRFAKFKQQCLAANHLLNEATYMDFKPQHKILTSSHNITQTSPVIHNYNPLLHTLHDDTHYSIHTHDGTAHNHTDTLPHTIYTPINNKNMDDDGYNNQDFVNMFDNNDYTNDKYTNDDHVYLTENDQFKNEHEMQDNHDDEDELPLVLISKKSKEKTKKKSRKKKKVIDETLNPKTLANIQESVNQETHTIKEDSLKSERNKKVVRAGFSSRMVQETNEYVVIKLTREQVLLEMSERSRTDAYMSSPFKCEKCVKGFNFQDVLDTHLEKHSVKNGSLECDMCGQYCPSAVSLRGHIKSHTTRYQCKVCGAVRAARQHLVEHHARHAGAAPAYTCLHCAFTTDKRTVMQRHARGHAPREPHACDKCGKLFKSVDYLRLHAARHDKSPRFQCSLCPDSFVYHSLLRKHVRCVHERREFYCVECDVHFKCAESLRVHFKKAKKHRDSTTLTHACPSCPGRFPSAGALAAHLGAAHDARRQHACRHCPRSYSTKDAARAHAWRVHARGDARASCPHCHASFARKSVLLAHLRARRGACGPQLAALEKEELQQYENKIEV